MNRIDRRFSELRASGQKALIPYLTAGYPSAELTLPLLKALDAAGVDVIELGVPFSDPIADGPTIQRASATALARGIKVPAILEIVRRFRKDSETPIVLFGAYNPFLHYGVEKFVKDAAQAGADGLLIPDMPVEEAAEIKPSLEKAGLHLIELIAPTTPPDRQEKICAQGSGFIYFISVKGVTGARTTVRFDVSDSIEEIRKHTDLPVVVGFGIATPEQAADVARTADGSVVGSSLIDFIGKNENSPELPTLVRQFMAEFKQAMRAIQPV